MARKSGRSGGITRAALSAVRTAEPEVRIHLPPADSRSLSRIPLRRSRTPAFRAGVRGWLDGGVGRDAKVFRYRTNGRRYLCRAIFQYRSAADGIGENATPGPNELGPFSGLNLR